MMDGDPSNPKAIRALLLERDPDHAQRLLLELARVGWDVTARRVDTATGMREALADASWDIVLSDYDMGAFSALDALALLRESATDLPFIIISSTIGEEAAVEALKAGADDFLVKGRLARLAPCMERALREAQTRREQRRTEEVLRASEHKYRLIVETSLEGVWVIGADGTTTYVNARMAEMLGLPAPALIGRAFSDFINDASKASAAASLARWRAGKSERREFEFRRPDGTEFWALLSTSPMLDARDGYLGALAMVTDITEQRKLQAQLMVSDRMASVGILAAGVAHEINNPLSAAIANIELALRDLAELSAAEPASAKLREIEEELSDAREGAERVRDIVRDLKVFSRTQDEVKGPVSVERVLDSSARMAWTEVRHRARLTKDYARVPLVDVNEPRLSQVFLNLIVNAAHAIPEGRTDDNEIRLSTRLDDRGLVVIEVRDTGSGMSPEVLKQAFTPFFTTKPIGVGTGLGLSICHRIISSFGGEISVESEAGKGSVFRVFLPAARASSASLPATRAPSVAPRPKQRGGAVLVVDDEAIVGAAIRRALSAEHDVTATTSAQEALDLIAGGKCFDVIICDLMMPHMTGMDLHAALSDRFPEQARRMIFLTGGAFTAGARNFLAQIDNTHVEKPFNVQSLRALVRERVDQNGQADPALPAHVPSGHTR